MINYQKKITFFQIEKKFDELSKKIFGTKLPKGFRQFILYAISELLNNVKEHSKATRVFLELKVNKGDFLFRITDNGIGFRKSYLFKKIYPKDDFSAIEFALSGLSTKKLNERGFGLYTIRRFIENLKGEMIIETGKAVAKIENNIVSFKKAKMQIRGVKITIKTEVKNVNFYKLIE